MWDSGHTGEDRYTKQVKDYCDSLTLPGSKTPGGLLFLDYPGSLSYAANAAFICIQMYRGLGTGDHFLE